MTTNAPTGNDNRQGAAHGKGELACADSGSTGWPSYQLSAVERAFQLAESGTVQKHKGTEENIGERGFWNGRLRRALPSSPATQQDAPK